MNALLGKTVHGNWEPGIGDPTVFGWATVVAYLTAAFFCAIQSRSCRHDPFHRKRESTLWMGLAVALLLLGINKQLDLQSWFTHVARDLARSQGWYDQRRIVQKWFIVGVASGGVLVVGLMVWFFLGSLRRNALAMVGITFLVCFVVIRAASFHHVDKFLRWRGLSMPMNAILELSGIACILLAAILGLRRGSRRSGYPAASGLNSPARR